jgi:type I restriction-modification system DNA methylase subunit
LNHQSLSAFIWSVADLLRGDYKQSDYGKVILPFTVLRRLDCVLEPTKAAVLAELAEKQKAGLNPEPFLLRKAGQSFSNISQLDLRKLIGDQDNVRAHLTAYVQGFSANVRDIFERFEFAVQIDRLAKANLLYLVTEKFAAIDLHPKVVDNAQMGLVFEELIRKFAELSNETAGEHFTPREVIRLMVNLIFVEDDDVLTKPGVVRTIYDPAAGTGGMLSVAEEHLTAMNPQARMTMFGQELNPESYAICKADMLIKGQCYMMNSRPLRYQVELVQYGAAQEQFNIGHAVNFFAPAPSREEQVKIASELDTFTREIDLLVDEAQAAIKLLLERRIALISATVTGKIDVRGLAPAEAEAA